MGADEGFLLSDRVFAGSDTLATSYSLAAGLKAMDPADLIFCGTQTADGDTAQVPAEIAEHLGIACLTNVSRLCSAGNGAITVNRALDNGDVRAEAKTPAVLTLRKGINVPRFPRLMDMVQAASMSVKVLTAADLDLDAARISLAGSPTQVVRVFTPERNKETRMLTSPVEEQIEELLDALARWKFV
jgi:electron transfer flavoprotein beta subunit